jgi:hypothetical protein
MKTLSDNLFYDLLHSPLNELQKQFGSQLRQLGHYRINGNDESYTYFSRYSPNVIQINKWTLSLKEGTYEIHIASENSAKRFLRFQAKKPMDIKSELEREHYHPTKHYLKGLSACVYQSEADCLIVSRSSMLAMGY